MPIKTPVRAPALPGAPSSESFRSGEDGEQGDESDFPLRHHEGAHHQQQGMLNVPGRHGMRLAFCVERSAFSVIVITSSLNIDFHGFHDSHDSHESRSPNHSIT